MFDSVCVCVKSEVSGGWWKCCNSIVIVGSVWLQIFTRAKVYFSIGGVHFNGRPLTYVPSSSVDLALEHARNLTIPLENRAGRFVRLHLFFRSTWIVLGEVYFHSGMQSH